MAMGYHDSYKYIENGIRTGRIKAEVDGLKVYVSGDTYNVKEHIKKNYYATWDRDRKCWVIDIERWSDKPGYMKDMAMWTNQLFGTNIEIPAAE